MQKEWHKKISKVHGTGLFAKNDIAKKKKIIEYFVTIITYQYMID